MIEPFNSGPILLAIIVLIVVCWIRDKIKNDNGPDKR